MRMIGSFLLFLTFFTLFMVTVHDRRSRNAFNLGASFLGLVLSIIVIIFVLFSDEHRWTMYTKIIMTIYFVIVFLLFGYLWMSGTKQAPPRTTTNIPPTVINSPQQLHHRIGTYREYEDRKNI
jgi:protein-S-isoprenylcysteine O-methyltransferase Ste14